MKNQLTLYFLLLSFSFFLLTCDTSEPPPPDNGNGNEKPQPNITLTVDDSSPTEVWLNLVTENISLPDTISLLRNNKTVSKIELFDSNYVIYENSLLPSQSYTYQVTRDTIKSNEAVAVTMDTTSHDFSYEIFEFGEHRNSILRDVAIIDENNIWAVGAIYLNDSTGQRDSKLYNAVHWDGSEWKTQRITVNYNNRAITPEMLGIYAFSESDIWTTSGIPTHWDGQSWVQYHLFDMGILSQSDGILSKLWGSSTNDVYFVGSLGTIAQYNGSSWRKIESGTNIFLSDIYGANQYEAYVTGDNSSKVEGILLKGGAGGFSVLKESGIVDKSQLFDKLYGELSAVWIDEKGTLYTGGRFLFQHKRSEWGYVTSFPNNYLGGNNGAHSFGFISGIRGNKSNDYVVSGERNTLRHYNGISWKQIGMPFSQNNPNHWHEVEQKGDLIVAVGRIGSKAIIIKLKR